MNNKSTIILSEEFLIQQQKNLVWHINIKTIGIMAVLVSFMLMLAFSVIEFAPAILVSYLVFGIIGFFFSLRIDHKAIPIFLIVYGFACFFSVVLYIDFLHIYGVPYVGGGSDELYYEELGRNFANNYSIFEYGAIKEHFIPSWDNSGYVYLIGLLTKFGQLFGGEHTMVPRLFNAGCLGLLSVIVYTLGERLCLKRKTAIFAALYTGCLPLMMWITLQTLRDTLLATLLVTVVFVWVPNSLGILRYSLFKSSVITSLIAAVVFELRPGQAVVALLLFFVGAMTAFYSRKRIIWTLWILIIIAIVSYYYIIFSVDLNVFIDNMSFAQTVYAKHQIESSSGTGLSKMVFETQPPLSYIFRTAFALISPFPVLSSQFYTLWLSLGTLIQILFIPFLFKGLFVAIRKPNWWIVICAFVLLFIGMSFFTFTIRHMAQYMPFAILITAIGYDEYAGRHKTQFIRMSGLIVLMGIIYFVLKI